ncbi:uncharacterized protein LOC131017606 [Salvia miltiorrhiza]|uniref:uncharacterized protein LOC131017606 n=1 Tax=Salvia miltiorrhiza TaxID=226208 RepID=UPI0025ABEB0D|nr:uncharacterized protein LOC131017606 [Salvia miltiorrhiza]
MAMPIIFGHECSHALTTQSRSLQDKTSKKRKRHVLVVDTGGSVPISQVIGSSSKNGQVFLGPTNAILFHIVKRLLFRLGFDVTQLPLSNNVNVSRSKCLSKTSCGQRHSKDLLRNFKTPSCVAMREYYCYLFQIRTDDITNILRTGRVIQQFQIDTYVKIETQRLEFFLP